MSGLANGREGSGIGTGESSRPHVALFPTAGAGHLMPFLRLASTLIRRGCRVTLIIAHPTVSVAETRLVSRFLAAFPDQAEEKHLMLLPLDAETVNTTDPFFLRWAAIRRSASLLSPILSSLSPPLSALISDCMLFTSTIPVTQDLQIPNFVLFASSPPMFSMYQNFPVICNGVTIASLELPGWSLPPVIINPDIFVMKMYKENGLALGKAAGVLLNSFDGLEPEAIRRNKTEATQLPCPVFRVGPFPPEELESDAQEGAVAVMEWLEKQPERSVVYVSFGNRTAMETEQIRALASGLVMSGSNFLFVLKTTVVDKEEEQEEELEIEKTDRGFVFKGWLSQAEILGHRAVGGFISHCGWNSLTEAALNGVRILAWPQQGEQKVNAELVEAGGWGRLLKGWRLEKNASVPLKAEDIAETVKEVMGSEEIKWAAAAVGEASRKAIGGGGSSYENWSQILRMWN